MKKYNEFVKENFFGLFDNEDDKIVKKLIDNIDDIEDIREYNYLEIYFTYKGKNMSIHSDNYVDYHVLHVNKDIKITSKYIKKLHKKLKDILNKKKEEEFNQKIKEQEEKIKNNFENLKKDKDNFIQWVIDIFNDDNYKIRYNKKNNKLYCHEKYPKHDKYSTITISLETGDIEITFSYPIYKQYYKQYKGTLTKSELERIKSEILEDVIEKELKKEQELKRKSKQVKKDLLDG